jgi:hypothetical protein
MAVCRNRKQVVVVVVALEVGSHDGCLPAEIVFDEGPRAPKNSRQVGIPPVAGCGSHAIGQDCGSLHVRDASRLSAGEQVLLARGRRERRA